MKKQKDDAAWELAIVRKEILTYCDNLPQIIKTHGPDAFGHLTLSIGKCFAWIGPRLDAYTLHQPLPGIPPLATVAGLGEQLRVLGLDILHNPTSGELKRTVATLKRQTELLQMLERLRGDK